MNKKETLLFFVKHYLPHKKITLFSVLFISLLTFLAYHFTLEQTRTKAMKDLALLLELRHAHLQRYFSSVDSELSFWTEHGELRIATEELSYAWQKDIISDYLGDNPYPREQREKLYTANNGNDYDRFHNVIHHLLKPLTEKKQAYADILIINNNADIIYSVKKHPDYGQNLRQTQYRNSPLGKLYTKLSNEQQTSIISDASLYSPAEYQPLLFAGKNMYYLDSGWLGTLVVAIPLDVIGNIMQSPDIKAAGVNSYIVGQDDRLRTTSNTHSEKVLQQEIAKIDANTKNKSLLTDQRFFAKELSSAQDAEPWILIAEKPLNTVHKPSIQIFFILFSKIILLFLFAFIVSRFILRWIEGELR